MTTKHTSLFLPEEHRIISDWLNVKPKGEVPRDLTSEDAIEKLGLDAETMYIHSIEDYAVAAILLERVQGRLPQWGAVKDGETLLARDYRDRAAERVIEITPSHLFTLNWADSGPGYSWPESYYVTFVPLYDVFIVTGSVDCTDLYGVTDFALGHFAKDKEIVRSSAAIILREWEDLTMYNQHRWQYLFDEGLIDQAYADKLANSIWDEYGEPREKRKGVPYPAETATRRMVSGKGANVSQTTSAGSDNLVRLHS